MGEIQNKIRIFALAKELSMDSKVLIKHCNDAGVPVKSSALAAISPEEKQIVLDYLSKVEAAEKPAAQETPTPSRDVGRELPGRVRNLRDMSPRDRGRKLVAGGRKDELQGGVAVEEAAPEINRSVPLPVTPAAELATEEVIAPTTIAEEPVVEIPQPEPVESEPAVTAESVEEPGAEPATDKTVPPDIHRREDYIHPHGAIAREMKPRGTGGDGTRGSRERQRSRPQMPMLAAMPTFKPKDVQKPAAGEQKAQKPDIRLTPEQFESRSPLADRLLSHKTAEDKKGKPGKRKETAEVVDDESARLRGGGHGLEVGRKERRRQRHQPVEAEETEEARKIRLGRTKKRRSGAMDLKTRASIELPISVRSLSEAIGRPAKAIISSLFKRGQMVTINQMLDEELAWEIAAELGVELEIVRQKSVEEELDELFKFEEEEAKLGPRPPIVTILGHVDHGKTTLLDKIRSTNVAAGEAGGITQHIRAYQIEHNGQKITFVDTPGHAAFGEMRARGANVTDVIVLVVAANDSVMPQTVECISHAKAAGAPIIVAMNKIDLPDVREQRVLTDLATHGVQPQEWGGEVEVVRTSGLTGQGLDDLLETILLTAEINELKANPTRDAVGVCFEGFRDEGLGAIAWLIVQKGTLRVGDVVLCGATYGRIRSMFNDRGEPVDEAPPSTPVKVTGLDEVPGAGDRFYVLDDLELARTVAEERRAEGRVQTLAGRNKPRTLDDILNAARDGAVQDLNLIIKADTPGSIEALRHEIEKFEHPEVRVRILHEAVGGVNESDVYLASASDAIIIAFHVIAEDRAMQLADQEGVEIRRYEIIYEVTDQIKRTLEGLLQPEQVKVSTGRAIVLQTFSISRVGTIAGCRVLSGTIERSNRVHVIRDQKVMNDYPIASLRRVKDDVKEVREGMECGIRLEGFNDIKEGDLLEAFRIDVVKRTLD